MKLKMIGCCETEKNRQNQILLMMSSLHPQNQQNQHRQQDGKTRGFMSGVWFRNIRIVQWKLSYKRLKIDLL